jgi:L-lysine exporter family protein LysE/ArgO
MTATTISLSAELSVFVQAFGLGLGLIVAIGAQNAFVLRQGLRGEHVGLVVGFCALADASLIAAGVLGMATVLQGREGLAQVLAIGAACFLGSYGIWALRRARSKQHLSTSVGGKPVSPWVVLAQAAGFTLLNPHVYLDTVLLVGSIGAQQTNELLGWFIGGASTASLLWFVLLGFGARWLAPVFAKPGAWQMLDLVIGIVMLTLAGLLVRHVMLS